jgi:predicted O-methyltransferase YrrM
MRCPFEAAKQHFGEDARLIIAEVGVAFGDNAMDVYAGLKPAEFHLVDRWNDDWAGIRTAAEGIVYTGTQMKQFVEEQLGHLPGVRLVQAYSQAAVGMYADHYFDLVYIDGDHSYEGCLADLNSWYSKVRPGGIFGGDDYFFHPDVLQAVTEFGEREGLTVHTGHSKTQWWVFKPENKQ